MQLTALLQAAQSADASVRTQAEQTLSTLQQQQYGDLCVGLSAELADASKPVDARRLAGLILKNTLDAKEDARKVRSVGKRRALCHPLITCPQTTSLAKPVNPEANLIVEEQLAAATGQPGRASQRRRRCLHPPLLAASRLPCADCTGPAVVGGR